MTVSNAIHLFTSDYDYGLSSEQIEERNPALNLLDNVTSSLTYRSFLYPGSTRKFDTNRIVESKEQLKSVGGRSIRMKTPDGEFLDGIHIKAKNFKDIFEKYLTLIALKDLSDKSQEMIFTLKPEFCKREKALFFPSYTYEPSDEGAKEFLKHLQSLRFGELRFDGQVPDFYESKEKNKGFLESFFTKKVSGVNFRLFYLPKQIEELRSINEEILSNPTVLISGGNGGLYIFYKTLAALYLIRGLDVILADFRGYGTSTGTPTAYNTKLDLETIYQYLSKEKKVENKDILLHAHCLGAGSATDLAARREGINIIVDRSFADIGGLLKQGTDYLLRNNKYISKYIPEGISQRISTLVSNLLNYSITYDNIKNLNKIKGNVAIVRADNDEIITEEEAMKQINSREEKTVIYTSVGHNNLWISSKEGDDNKTETEALNQFLLNNNLYRKIFELTPFENYSYSEVG